MLALHINNNKSKRSRNDLKLHGDTFQKIRKIPAKDEGQWAHHLATRVGGTPLGRAPYLVGPLETSRLQLQLYIYLLSGRKKSERRIHRVL